MDRHLAVPDRNALGRQGLLEGTWCLNPADTLSPGQAEEITRVCRAYPHLNDDAFIAEHLASSPVQWRQDIGVGGNVDP